MLFCRRVDDLPRRQVIRDHRFERELRSLIQDAREADEFVEGAEFNLARDPESGQRVSPNSKILGLPMALLDGAQIALYYWFDDTTVTLLSIARVA